MIMNILPVTLRGTPALWIIFTRLQQIIQEFLVLGKTLAQKKIVELCRTGLLVQKKIPLVP
jgi:hypothetical protein